MITEISAEISIEMASRILLLFVVVAILIRALIIARGRRKTFNKEDNSLRMSLRDLQIRYFNKRYLSFREIIKQKEKYRKIINQLLYSDIL